MDKLPYVIGPAPSELPLGEFKTKLSLERERIRRGLEFFKNVTLQKGAKGSKRGKVSPTKKLKALVAETGLSPKEIIKAIELMKKEAKQ